MYNLFIENTINLQYNENRKRGKGMNSTTFQINAPLFGEYDVVVCGGGIAGFASAVSAAPTTRDM